MAYSKITNVVGKSRLVAEDSNKHNAPTDIISKNWPPCAKHLYNSRIRNRIIYHYDPTVA